ncbi:MAG: alpha/beta hydrolase [Flavobacteriales bacterium]|nr:alpha/beta hydrolase [Flavobacteriales bacterium]
MKKEEFILQSKQSKEILIDVTYNQNSFNKKVIIFSHGFKGFKDWGPYNQIAQHFALNGFFFLKLNFSHNGTNSKNPVDFVDLDAFGNNNFSIELDDLSTVIDWLLDNKKFEKQIDKSNVSLLGHSRGGAISILKSIEDKRISRVISWASPADLLNRLPKQDKLQKWKIDNVLYVFNGRTKQNMPLYFQFYKNCIKNKSKLNLKMMLNKIQIPQLIIHGSNDTTVLIKDAYLLKKWNNNAQLAIIDGADHVFGGFHPYNLDYFPKHLEILLTKTILFLKD